MTRLQRVGSLVATAGFMFGGCGASLAQDSEAVVRAGTSEGTPDSQVALRVDGMHLRDADGETVTLRAINAGNWFLLEPWMFGQNLPDEATLLGVLSGRFGQTEADALIETHRDNWITQRDMDTIASTGFNAIRLPFHYRMVEAAPFELDPVGVGRLQSAMDIADAAGLYVILDMHAVPGGQSLDGPSGDATQNNIWTDTSAQDRFVWLWQELARRFKNQENFVAYDLMNEPFGDFVTDISGELIEIMDRTIRAVRGVDPNRLIFVPGPLQGVQVYGDPADRGWTNVGLTEHKYPGIFDGREATLGNLGRFTVDYLREIAEYCGGLDVPFLLGEFNPVFDRQGAPESAREIFDTCEDLGLQAAVWSYKLVKVGGGVGSDNWYLATNADNLTFSNIETASLSSITQTFEAFDDMPLAIDAAYAASMITPFPSAVLPEIDPLPFDAPAADAWAGWTIENIGDVALGGGQQVIGGGLLGAERLSLFTSGQDLFGNTDSFRLAFRQMPPSFTVSGVFEAFRGGDFAHAGVTLRASTADNAPHVSLIAFPDGRVLLKTRNNAGSGTSQQHLVTAGFPVGLGLERSGGALTAWVTDDRGEWRSFGVPQSPAIGSSPIGGFLGLANRSAPLTEVGVVDPSIDFPPAIAVAPTLDDGVNVVSNGSFEASGPTPSSVAGWTLTGNMSRQTGWTPLREGNALLAYRHWESDGNPSEASHNIAGLTPGTEYEWTAYANRDDPAGGVLASEVELRVENGFGPNRWLETRRFEVEEIETGNGWSRLQVRFVATQPSHRLKLVCYPAVSGNRDGAVKFETFVVSVSGG
ncbi:MAG: cellulase family glycosylhydrolase [Planctomycetota bacterium]